MTESDDAPVGDGASEPDEVVVTSRRDRDVAFERYVLPEIDVMLRVARSLTRHPADAEDLVQDSLVRAYRAIDRFDGRHPRAWLLTIVRNTNINRHRRRRPELLSDPDEQLDRLAAAAGADGATDPERWVDEQFAAEVSAALASLAPQFAQVVELVDIDGLSYAEAAAAMGAPIGTVMSRLHRARRKLREHLRRSGAAPMFADLVAGRAR